MKVLNIVETAFRATLEEQDDPALWCIHALRKAGMEHAVVLRGSAVCYAFAGQDPKGVRIGSLTVEHPRILDEDLADMKRDGIPVYVVREDAEARGLSPEEVVEGFTLLGRDGLTDLVIAHDQVWHW